MFFNHMFDWNDLDDLTFDGLAGDNLALKTFSDGIKMQLKIAGYKREELNIYADGDQLIIEANPAKKEEVTISSGDLFDKPKFKRAYRISRKLDLDKVNAKLEDGVLTITIPVKMTEQPKNKVTIF